MTGRFLASNGYVMTRVGIGHHLANCRGYAYEHRVVAETKIGRQLVDGEQVHHVDGDRQNNDPANLEVLTAAQHGVEHRTTERGLRMPGEPNSLVFCGCGCGETFLRYDGLGRPRAFMSGHNPHPTPTRTAVLRALADGPKAIRAIVGATDATPDAIRAATSQLARVGVVQRIGKGVYRLPEAARE